jgi:hypothetical protein
MKSERMRKIYFVLVGLVFISAGVYGQKLTGAQVLRNARSLYDQGRLHELPTVLSPQTIEAFDSDNEKVEAYKILVLTYIYLEEPEKADESMLQLLRTDHFFELTDADQIEFRNLYKKFRSKAVFSVGAKIGLNQTYVSVLKNHFIPAESKGQGEYKPSLGFHFAAVFEKELFAKGNAPSKFTAAPEIMFNTSSFTYNNAHIYWNDFEDDPDDADDVDENFASIAHKITHSSIQLNLLAQYKLYKIYETETSQSSSKFNPYVTLGPSVAYLMGSKFDGLLSVERRIENAGQFTNTSSYEAINFSVIAGGGVKYKLGSIYLTADVRYQYGLFNVVNGTNRYENTVDHNTIRTSYQYVDNDFTMNQAMFSIGLVYPYFNPKKTLK